MLKGLLRKVGACLMTAAVAASLTCCGNSESSSGTAETSAEVSGTTAVSIPPVTHDEMRDISSAELVKEIKAGWSLGNALDSHGVEDYTGLDTETSWGNPKATYELFTAVKKEGFNIVRIPVTWYPHMDADGNIDEEWMDRVQEVVDYAYGQDFFVILNIHHEEKLKKVWTQIGNRFQDYDDKLIFEGMNEPRKRNTPQEWNGGDKEGHEVVNQLNAAFIETIRGLGGNNPKRHLMIPSYAASITDGALNDFVFPEGDDKLIVSLHAYAPYDFALGLDQNNRDYNENDVKWVMQTIKTHFIDKGIPVIIGEFGAVNKLNLNTRANWAKLYVSEAKKIGVPCLWFDNGSFNGDGETLGLIDRKTCTWKFKEIPDAMIIASRDESE